MSYGPLDWIPLWLMLPILAAALWAALECGYELGRWRRPHAQDERDQPVGSIVASVLGLLALVLGFTFSLAAARFEARRQVVLEESNAIGTTYLRSRMLPPAERQEVQRLLREYVAVRIQGVQPSKVEQAIAESEKLQELLWGQAAIAAEKDPHSITTGLFIQTLNDVIDLHAKRIMVSMRSRIPMVIWGSLLFLAVSGVAAVGYQSGLATSRRSPVMVILVLTFTCVLYLIADLDRGQEGLLRVSQSSMLDLQHSMQPSTP